MATTTKAKTTTKADWSLTPRGPVSATTQGVLALAALATIGDVVALDPIWGAGATVAGAVATVLRSSHQAHAPAGLVYRLCCWLGAGSWFTYTLATTPWTQGSWAALGVGAVTAGILAPLARPKQRGRRTGRALVLRQSSRIGQDWEERIFKVCRIRARVTQVDLWPSRAGYDVHVDLPGEGTTRKQLAGGADALATDARLPEGCGVEIGPGQHRGAAVLRVSTVNRLHQDIDYPADYAPRSILEPKAIGEHRDSSPAQVLLREASGLVTGQKGSGKTNTLHVLTAGVGLCRDAVVWHIDLNGGGMSQAWLHPWLEGDSPRPAIDWAAADPDEALLIAQTAVAIAKDRKKSTRALKIKANASLMPVSSDLPEIVIILDEGGEALAPTNRDPVFRDLREALEELQRIGRNEACNVIFSSLRATGDMIAPNVRKQSAVRVGMYVQDEEELSFLFGWNRGVTIEDLPGPGCGFLQDGQGAPRPFRAYYMRPGDVVDAAVAIARTRPELDQAARDIAGQDYATRYHRMRAAFADVDQETTTRTLVRRPTPPPPAPIPAQRSFTLLSGGQAAAADASAWADPRDIARPRPAAAVPASADTWPDPMPRRTMLRAEQIATTTPARPLPELLRRALAAFGEDTRIHSEALAAALGILTVDDDGNSKPDTLTLAALLRPLEVTTLPRAFLRGGAERRGYAREDLAAAADRIARGALQVPPEVANWPAA
uniref:hypothetical protein n=1 Tax=Sphaerisporangium sp. CA-236357 TaxID=3240030 RepID=UPI003F499C5D